MKSFSSASFATDSIALLERAAALVNADPQALFTDFQWFLFRAQNTVYFTAFSSEPFDKARLRDIVAEMVALAPQLTHGFVGARPGQPLPPHLVDAITSVAEVNDFDGYPDKWLEPGLEIYHEPGLPLFRVKAIRRRGGPDAQGRAGMVLVRTSHALMEGSDSALLSRSQHAGHGVMADKARRQGANLLNAVLAWPMAPVHLFFASILAAKEKTMGFRSMTLPRRQIRALARKLGVRSRSLLFAVVTYALNDGDFTMRKRVLAAGYTLLDSRRGDGDDDYFRLRMLDAMFPVMDDLLDYLRAVDGVIGKVEQKDLVATQSWLNAVFGVHRRLSVIFPFLYGKRFFRFAGPYDVVLTLVPPHRTTGSFMRSILEPIWCGSYHPGTELCTFVPGREYFTLNFSMQTKYLSRTERIGALLAQLEQNSGDASVNAGDAVVPARAPVA